MEQKTMSNKYLETKEGSLEDAVLRALNPNSFKETLSLSDKKEESEEKEDITTEAHDPGNYDPEKVTQVGSKQKIKPNYNTKTHRLIVKDGKVKIISRDQWALKRKEMRKQGWDLAEDNTNNLSDDGEGMDKVQSNALKKKFKNRKDKDIDNDGDTDSSDEYLHKRRKAISKEMDEAHEIGTDEYAKYTRDMTPGQNETDEALDPVVRQKMKERQKATFQRDIENLKKRHTASMLRLSGKDKASGRMKNEEVEGGEKN